MFLFGSSPLLLCKCQRRLSKDFLNVSRPLLDFVNILTLKILNVKSKYRKNERNVQKSGRFIGKYSKIPINARVKFV